ncbi:hypothetical protein KIW84_045370, partial [Lathyrus oleraceus]
MSQYSTSSNRNVSHLNHVECKCGLPSPLTTEWNDLNPGRHFFGCGMYKGYKRCSHFVWYDEEMCQQANEVIFSMHKKSNQENVKFNKVIIREDQLKLKIKFLKMINKFTMERTL